MTATTGYPHRAHDGTLLAPSLRSTRLTDLRDRVQDATVVHEIGVRRGRPDGTVAVAALGALNLVVVRYGAQVTVDAFPTRNRFALTVPLGPMRVSAPEIRNEVLTSGFALAGDAHTVMRPDPHAGALVLSARMSRVEEHLGTLLGRPPHTALRFLPPTAPAAGPSALLDSAWRTACLALADTRAPLGPTVLRALEDQLLTAILLGLPHTSSAELLAGPADPPADAVERARAWLDDHHAEPLTVADIARAGGLGPRQLQEQFRRRLGTTPTALLRDLRLGHAHRALLGADGPESRTVAEIAYSCGFTHLSRFAQDYRARFGELPSETAQRSR
ncbi:AraC family transcriptional regulator [Amycolatopsis rhabdoformis]|uniref:AraC family transcriptional regulator n=1 Tax=Amycolatopsis rhabdoformis TaxID=1448059 RepID=A0ABZ1IGZ8_9PSEU|nr:AraC family transcriptional regulator [Amycolatopsis rhabdoformis]WSE32710.1 AraC family transcriptional regulator [Amycolatopsis rhabdoformis]